MKKSFFHLQCKHVQKVGGGGGGELPPPPSAPTFSTPLQQQFLYNYPFNQPMFSSVVLSLVEYSVVILISSILTYTAKGKWGWGGGGGGWHRLMAVPVL